jgi:hypothetical protein
MMEPAGREPICVLLLPSPLERFILRDQAEDLLRATGVIAVDPPRVPYGAYGRLPAPLGDTIASRVARRLLKSLRRRAGEPRVVVMFHALQYQLAGAIMAEAPDCELWYWRWDRYERAYDASESLRARLEELHEAAAGRAALIPAVSDELVRQERAAGRDATLVPLAADAFPDVAGGDVVAISLGHLGWRTDWALLRALSVGAVHEHECRDDPDFHACRQAANLVWLGAQDDAVAARLILCADVGIVPFKVEPFNDAALPYRILKYARLGRRTVAPALAGVSTWAEVVTTADGPEAFAEALLTQGGARGRPDDAVRAWALAQTARAQDEPLWQRLGHLGVDVRVTR